MSKDEPLDLEPIEKLLKDFTWEDFAPMVTHQYLLDCVAEVKRLREALAESEWTREQNDK